MGQYFFSVSKSEKDNILDQHKYLYDGYVTKYNQQSNEYPIYVQDLANDKMGITVNNKGVVKPYTNMNINETHTGSDMIGGDSHDQSEMKYRHLKNGTVDLDYDYISLGNNLDDDNEEIPMFDFDNELNDDPIKYEYDIEELNDYSSSDQYDDDEDDYRDLSMYNPFYGDKNFDFDDVDEDEKFDLLQNVNESLSMFKKFKKYN